MCFTLAVYTSIFFTVLLIRNLSVAFANTRATHDAKLQLKIWPSIAIHQQVSSDFLDTLLSSAN